MDWEKLKLFHTVAEAGSFTGAARQIGSSQSALSRQIRALEDSLNVALFNRHARGLVLTQEGEQLFQTARDVVQRIDAAEDQLLEAKERPSGHLRVATSVSFGSLWMTQYLKEFIRQYPDIDIELILSDSDVDLATRQADVAIRFHESEQADLIQRKLLPVHHHIYGSPEYLSERGTPSKPEDLDRHSLITYGEPVPEPIKDINWILAAGATSHARRPVLTANNIVAVVRAVEAGIGLAAIPDYIVSYLAPQLVRVLRDFEGPVFQTYFVYPIELRGAKRVTAFRDFVVSNLEVARRQMYSPARNS